MKQQNWILSVLITAIILCACKKNDLQPPDDNNNKPEPTKVGIADGVLVSKTLDENGGTITSGDGKVELVLPAGALKSSTAISIQPISNNAPGGVGKAYRFLPDGIQFASPVTVKFHYTDEQLASTLPGLMGIAFQDTNRVWYRVKKISDDAVGKAISAPITHFSDWTFFESLIINPPAAAIKVNETVDLKVLFVSTVNDADELAPLIKNDLKVIWSANGVENGNSAVGTLTGNSYLTRTYKAPASEPTQNPVAVTAQLPISFQYNGETFNKPTLVSNINIGGDDYVLELIETRNDIGIGGLWVTDSASMDINIKNSGVAITNIKNFAPKSGPNISTNGCTFSVTADNIGSINITTATGEMRIQSASERAVQLFFKHTGAKEPGYRQYCPITTPPFDVTGGGTAFDGHPITLWFDLTGDILHDDVSYQGYSFKATLTRKK